MTSRRSVFSKIHVLVQPHTWIPFLLQWFKRAFKSQCALWNIADSVEDLDWDSGVVKAAQGALRICIFVGLHFSPLFYIKAWELANQTPRVKGYGARGEKDPPGKGMSRCGSLFPHIHSIFFCRTCQSCRTGCGQMHIRPTRMVRQSVHGYTDSVFFSNMLSCLGYLWGIRYIHTPPLRQLLLTNDLPGLLLLLSVESFGKAAPFCISPAAVNFMLLCRMKWEKKPQFKHGPVLQNTSSITNTLSLWFISGPWAISPHTGSLFIIFNYTGRASVSANTRWALLLQSPSRQKSEGGGGGILRYTCKQISMHMVCVCSLKDVALLT